MYLRYGDYSNELLSELYDFLPLYALRTDVEFYVDWANRVSGDVLELGCGTGRVSIPVADSGSHVTVLDYSMPMLQRFKKKLVAEPNSLAERIDIIRGDMTNFTISKLFDLVIIPFRPFQHLISIDDQINCLKSVRKHLRRDGILIFDVFNPSPDRLLTSAFGPEVDVPKIEITDGRSLTRTSQVVKSHWKDKWNEYEFIYRLENEFGGVEEIRQQTSMRYFFVEELELILEMGGFKIDKIFGDFDSSDFHKDSPEQIYVVSPLNDQSDRNSDN